MYGVVYLHKGLTMTPEEIYTLVSSILLLYVAMMWSTQGLLNTSIKLAFYITGTVGLMFTASKFIPIVV